MGRATGGATSLSGGSTQVVQVDPGVMMIIGTIALRTIITPGTTRSVRASVSRRARDISGATPLKAGTTVDLKWSLKKQIVPPKEKATRLKQLLPLSTKIFMCSSSLLYFVANYSDEEQNILFTVMSRNIGQSFAQPTCP